MICRFRWWSVRAVAPVVMGVLMTPALALAAAAARVEFAVGNVTAASGAGPARMLAKGAEVSMGDTVYTNDGRAQLRFSDGAYVSLQPQSEFRIDDYRFNGKADGTERGFFSLLKGGLRTITGLVGRSNRRNYQVSTTVATIGIRGTEYTLGYDNGVRGTIGEGRIDVCNGAGCINLTTGESYHVPARDTPAVMSEKKIDLPAPPPPQAVSLEQLIKGDEVNQAGNPALFRFTGSPTLIYGEVCDPHAPSVQTGTITFDANGAATSLDALSISNVVDVYNDGILALGRGPLSNGDMSHYVAASPISSLDLSNLGAAKVIGNYTLVAATTPTALDIISGVQLTGHLDGGQLSVDFSASKVKLDLSFSLAGSSFALSKHGTPMSSGVFHETSCSVTGGGACQFKGFVAGAQGMAAGLSYRAGVTLPDSVAVDVIGAAGFQRKP